MLPGDEFEHDPDLWICSSVERVTIYPDLKIIIFHYYTDEGVSERVAALGNLVTLLSGCLSREKDYKVRGKFNGETITRK